MPDTTMRFIYQTATEDEPAIDGIIDERGSYCKLCGQAIFDTGRRWRHYTTFEDEAATDA